MNYERIKKVIVWLSLVCVFALPVAATFTTPVFAQGYYRRYQHDRDYWRRRHEYRPPLVRHRFYGYPEHRYGYYDRYGRFHWTGYYGRGIYHRWYY